VQLDVADLVFVDVEHEGDRLASALGDLIDALRL
jgi:hypothetical protein